jgi:hypothetical protein
MLPEEQEHGKKKACRIDDTKFTRTLCILMVVLKETHPIG